MTSRALRAALVRALAAGVLVVLAAPGAALAQPAPQDGVRIRRVDAGAFPSVAVTVSIDGAVNADSIRVTENGSPAEILTVRSLREAGGRFDVVLAIDTSNSVQGAPLQAAIGAARAFVTNLPGDTPVGLVTFDAQAVVVQELTEDREAILRAIASLGQTRPGTALYDAVVTASSLFSGERQHNVVLLTDGADVGSAADLDAAIAAAQGAKTAVFSIGLEGRRIDESVLRALSGATSGTYTVASQANLQAIYERLAGQLTRQFVVTYRSRSAAGAQVTVGVEAGGAADSAFVLMPPRPVGPESPEVTRPLLTGAVGLSIALGLTFLTVFLLVAMALGAAARARRDRELARRIAAARLQGTAPAGEPRAESGLAGWIPQPVVDAAERVAEVGGFGGYLEARLERAGLPLRAGELVSLSVIAAALGAFIGGLIFQSAVFAVVFAVAAGAVPYIWVNVAQARRVNRLHEQLPDALMILSSSMRAGHSFLQALDMVAKEIGDPAAPEFARVVAEIRLGRPVDEAMLAMADRVGTEEFRWAVMAVNVQREVGGNLAEILDTVAETVREREQVRRTIRVLSAEGRLSIRILVALPPLMVLYLVKVNPDYMRLLWTTGLGWVMVGVAVTLMTIGIFWARRIVKIDV